MANTIIKRYNGSSMVELYPKTTHTQIVASGTPSSSTFLRGDGTWAQEKVHSAKNTGTVAGTWSCSIDGVSSYYEGLTIAFFTAGVGGASTNTLNVNGLGAKTIYYDNNSKLTTHYGAETLVMLYYDATQGRFYCHDFYYSADDYRIRWQYNITAGTTIHGYQLLMEGVDGKFYPVTEGGSTGNTNTVSTAEFKVGGTTLWYESSTDRSANDFFGAYYLYEAHYSSNMEYWNNRDSGWATQGDAVYLVGSINANGNYVLDNTSYTSFMTQTEPTTADGKVYMKIGRMGDNYDDFRLESTNPLYEYKDGKFRLYVPDHTHSSGGGTLTFTDHGYKSSTGSFLFTPSDGDNSVMVFRARQYSRSVETLTIRYGEMSTSYDGTYNGCAIYKGSTLLAGFYKNGTGIYISYIASACTLEIFELEVT